MQEVTRSPLLAYLALQRFASAWKDISGLGSVAIGLGRGFQGESVMGNLHRSSMTFGWGVNLLAVPAQDCSCFRLNKNGRVADFGSWVDGR